MLSNNAVNVLESRYLLKNDQGKIIETPHDLFERVAILMTIPDIIYDCEVYSSKINKDKELFLLDDWPISIGKYKLNQWHVRAFKQLYNELRKNLRYDYHGITSLLAGNQEFSQKFEKRVEEYIDLMEHQHFMPNSPTLMNAGTRLGQLSACFVLDIEDDMENIMETAKNSAMIFKSGGGVGINYSKLRGEGSMVSSTTGVASGPVSFMEIINSVTNVVKQGGKRRGANMGILDWNHPDIRKFIANKKKAGVLENFNISVGVDKDFWKSDLLDLIAESAWSSAEPGLVFYDNMNKYNVFEKARGRPLRATNPCGEQSLYPNESCNLGSINVSSFYTKDGFDWDAYRKTIRICTRFLDNVIDVNLYPIKDIEIASKESRRIGLGVMGVADLLYKMNIPYNSTESYYLQSRLAEVLSYESMVESVSLARQRGEFPLCKQSDYPNLPIAGYYELETNENWDKLREQIEKHGIRNVVTTTVAPTGSISMIADCSSGIEPNYALIYEKHVVAGKFYYTNSILSEKLNLDDTIKKKIVDNYGSIQNLEEIPKEVRDVFVTSLDLHWKDHIKIQSIWQKWISNAISKTINMPEHATIKDVKDAYKLAYEMGLKGITIYRDGSRSEQVMHTGNKCPKCKVRMKVVEKCESCPLCGYSVCSVA